jgi:hypothetical protein
MSPDAVERYVRLGLRLGRHVDGLVDAYYGPPALAAAVDAEPVAEASALAHEAEELLGELDDGWLRDQVAGLHTCARALAGEPMSYADEVEGCYGVRPARTDEAVFAAARERLDELLPGAGTTAERVERWRGAQRIPAERVEATVAGVIEEARTQTRALVELPEEETVELVTVRDVPYLAFCAYLGGYRSRIEVNLDLPVHGLELLVLAIHETYAGHHTERTAKEERLVRGQGLLEETIALVPTPQSLVAEGIAGLAPWLLLEGEGGPALAAVLHDAGVELDLRHALAVERALEPCAWAEVNAALMLYEDGADDAELQPYLERHALLGPEVAAHVIRFLREPSSRTYIVTYPAGRELCRAWVGGDPARFRRLVTEQVRAGELTAQSGATKR